MTNIDDLIINRKYYLEIDEQIYIGTFIGPSTVFVYHLCFTNLTRFNKVEQTIVYIDKNKNDKYYDIVKTKYNAEKAIQQMEQRSLNMILKKLVNEEFQW
jgi:hypothetical protein